MVIPTFGLPGSSWKNAEWCASHRSERHIDVINKHCEKSGCTTNASFGPLNGIKMRCSVHRLSNDINVCKKRCSHPGCSVKPIFGQTVGDAKHCVLHRLEEEIDVVNKTCKEEECLTRATYGEAGHKPTHCAAHANKAIMISQPRQKCGVARCATPGPGLFEHLNQRFCEVHAPKDIARCLVTTTCKSCLLDNVLTTNGTCDTCAPERVQRVRHMKEEQVAFALTHGGLRIAARDVILEGKACGLERPDFQIASVPVPFLHWVYVECDEWQHSSEPRECHITRMRNLAEVRGVPVVFIRFNPDGYVPGESADSAYKPRPLPLTKRFDTLVRWVKYAALNGPPPGHIVSVLYLFYDGFTNNVTHADWNCLVSATL